MKRITKKQSEQYVNSLTEFFNEVGVLDNPFRAYQWTVKTLAGDLYVKVDTDNVYTLTTFMKFKEPNRAKLCNLDCNPFSGKYNFHAFAPVDEAINDIKASIYAITEIILIQA